MSPWARFFSRRKRMMDDLDHEIRDFIERDTPGQHRARHGARGSTLCGSAKVW